MTRKHSIVSKFKPIYKAIMDSAWMQTVKIFFTSKNAEEAGYNFKYDRDIRKAIRPAIFFAFISILTGLAFFVVWGGLAPLDQAAIADGVIIVAGSNKTIQNQEGGTIESINVKEGEEVKVGDILIKLNDTAAKAQVNILKSELTFAKAIEYRLTAELEDYNKIEWDPNEFNLKDGTVKRILKTQEHLFATRKLAKSGKVHIAEERITQRNEEITGYEAQLKSVDSQFKLLSDETNSVESLYSKGLATKEKLSYLKRQLEDLQGRKAQTKAAIASAKQEIAQLQLEILNINHEFQKEIGAEVKENHSRILELTDRYNSALDVLTRTVIRSPVDGVVTELQYHTIGGVISPGQKIMDIVPKTDELIVEARVQTRDIDSIYPGLLARVQLGAYKSRLVPRLDGKVIYVSADKHTDQAHQGGQSYYIARVKIDDDELKKLTVEIKLAPGMPATVFIVKGERTFLQYMISPIMDSFFRAFKES